ncbi:Putative phenylalanine aminotransferase [Corynebacterium glaucum]|mgnify:FL=1|uniref:Putative phenylalanine aminotransferase n=1 Tax=Corynebacterium glaucum TaxID=187491 RepID=A0A1Q2HTE0_9CORY|nr:aminotransferase class I/II-fold pyridoxal phosphate-dependent enzyme [Corynebacterium glaucum]AQQ14108.1 Putative phenylalanine aminotransferase [Corynebacterium glaucum]WJZ06630.1 Putative phenylalanine aminotransferase [Corynebacterium glaucum]
MDTTPCDAFTTELRETLADHLGLPTAQVAVGNNTLALLGRLVGSTCASSSKVLYTERTDAPPPPVLGQACPQPVPFKPDGSHDLEQMLSLIDDSTCLIFLSSPAELAGDSMTTRELTEFMRTVPERVTVMLDETHLEYPDEGAGDEAGDEAEVVSTDAIAAHPNLVVLRSFNKAYGLADVRVAYAFGSEALISSFV